MYNDIENIILNVCLTKSISLPLRQLYSVLHQLDVRGINYVSETLNIIIAFFEFSKIINSCCECGQNP